MSQAAGRIPSNGRTALRQSSAASLRSSYAQSRQANPSIAPSHTYQGQPAFSEDVLTDSQSLTPLQMKILEKQKEYETLQALRETSAHLAKYFEELETKVDNLVEGSEAIALILSNWQDVFRAVNLAGTSLATSKDEVKVPDTLVRIPIMGETTSQ